MSIQYFNQVMESLHQVSEILDGTLSDHEMTAKDIDDLFRAHKVIALHILLDMRQLLSGVLHVNLVEARLQAQNFAGMNLDIGRLTRKTAGRLVNHDARIGQAVTHARLACR